jgi:hypothetical protein
MQLSVHNRTYDNTADKRIHRSIVVCFQGLLTHTSYTGTRAWHNQHLVREQLMATVSTIVRFTRVFKVAYQPLTNSMELSTTREIPSC